MTDLVLSDLQQEVHKWAIHNFGEYPAVIDIAGLTEELGEFSRALFKQWQGIRGTHDQWQTEAEKEAGDCLLKLMSVCARAGIDLETATSKRWEEVCTRDWITDPIGHGL